MCNKANLLTCIKQEKNKKKAIVGTLPYYERRVDPIMLLAAELNQHGTVRTHFGHREESEAFGGLCVHASERDDPLPRLRYDRASGKRCCILGPPWSKNQIRKSLLP